jgi:hypothetical protein
VSRNSKRLQSEVNTEKAYMIDIAAAFYIRQMYRKVTRIFPTAALLDEAGVP